MKKKLSAILMCAVLALSLAACGDSAGSSDETGAGTETENTEASTAETAEETTVEGEGVVELGQYSGLTVEVAKTEVTDDDVNEYSEYIYNQYAGEIDWNKTAEIGDTLNIDFVGKVDGEAFDGGSSEDYDIVLGSNTFFAGFEDAMVGMAVGDVWDLDLQFPDDYWSEDLAGKPCVFTVTCNAVIPPMSDESVAALQKEEYSNVAELNEMARSVIEAYYQNDYESDIVSSVLSMVMESTTFGSIPEDKLAERVEYVTETYTSVASNYGVDLDTYLGVYGTTVDEVAANYAKQDLVFAAIAEAEGFTVTDDEVDAYVQEMIDYYGDDTTVEEVYETESREEYREALILQKAYNFLIEVTNVVEPSSEE